MKIDDMSFAQLKDSLRSMRRSALKAHREGDICRVGLEDAFSEAELDLADEEGKSFAVIVVELTHDSDVLFDHDALQDGMYEKLAREFDVDDYGFDVEDVKVLQLKDVIKKPDGFVDLQRFGVYVTTLLGKK